MTSVFGHPGFALLLSLESVNYFSSAKMSLAMTKLQRRTCTTLCEKKNGMLRLNNQMYQMRWNDIKLIECNCVEPPISRLLAWGREE